jgi:hypothetical protein
MPEANELFHYFVLQQQMAAMMYLGKMVRPDTGQVERNLDAAKFIIDLLGMLEDKTKGNLTAEESHLLEQVLTTLRLNYVDERKREEAKPDASMDESAPAGERTEGDPA